MLYNEIDWGDGTANEISGTSLAVSSDGATYYLLFGSHGQFHPLYLVRSTGGDSMSRSLVIVSNNSTT
jgi:hypothetical protein